MTKTGQGSLLPISCHGIIFGTHMKALGMMGEEFSLPFLPSISHIEEFGCLGQFFGFSHTSKIYKCSWIVWPT